MRYASLCCSYNTRLTPIPLAFHTGDLIALGVILSTFLNDLTLVHIEYTRVHISERLLCISTSVSVSERSLTRENKRSHFGIRDVPDTYSTRVCSMKKYQPNLYYSVARTLQQFLCSVLVCC